MGLYPRVFGLDNSIGLTNALLGNSSLDEVISSTSVEMLKVITSGPLPPDSTLVLRSNRMKETIKALSDKADVVILDSPPALVVTDPIALSPQVDAIVMVLETQRTGRQELKGAVQSLQQANTPIIGVIFNKVSAKGKGSGASYYYYGYSENGGSEEPSNFPAYGILSRAFRIMRERVRTARGG